MNMKTLVAIALAVVSTSALAAEDSHPFYVRGQIGAGRSYFSDTTLLQSTDVFPGLKITGVNKPKLAGRIAAGYKFNHIISAELGYFQLASSSASFREGGHITTANLNINANAVDALVKASLPITDNISVFGGAGAAAYTTTYHLKGDDYVGGSTQHATAVRPEFTVGSSYQINENVAIDASFTQIVGKGNVDDVRLTRGSYLPDAQFLAAGVSYSF